MEQGLKIAVVRKLVLARVVHRRPAEVPHEPRWNDLESDEMLLCTVLF